jgi:hypothetical protein
MNAPSEREFGELLGEVRAVRNQVTDLQRTNSAEHAANARRMERIEEKLEVGLGKKADVTWVEKISEKVDNLNINSAWTRGRDNVLKGALGAAVAIGAAILGGYLHI